MSYKVKNESCMSVIHHVLERLFFEQNKCRRSLFIGEKYVTKCIPYFLFVNQCKS